MAADRRTMEERRVALVTGANKGIGFETVRALARRGCCVLLGARDKSLALVIQRSKEQTVQSSCSFRISPIQLITTRTWRGTFRP
jgi:NAD(P)-dependent dehydrogenase (short-subunit alcohol dehydrogenase family)